MTYYCPDIFDELIKGEGIKWNNFLISLDLDQNKENITQASGSDGGKSGEFFFFTYDNKFILKTIRSVH